MQNKKPTTFAPSYFRTWPECFESQFNNVFKPLYGSTQPSKSQQVHRFSDVSIMVALNKMHVLFNKRHEMSTSC